MDNKEKTSFDVIVYSMMIVAVVYAIVQTMLGRNNELTFKILLGLWILIAVTLTDFVEPMVNKSFDNLTSGKIKQYACYAITDACAYIFLYMFVINAGYYKEPVHYIFLGVGIILFIVKSLIYKEFRKKDSRQARFDEIRQTEMMEEEELRRERFEYMKSDDEEDVKVFMSRGNK